MFQLHALNQKSIITLLLILILSTIQIQHFDNMISDIELTNTYQGSLNIIVSESELHWTLLSSGKLRGGFTQTVGMTKDSEGNTYYTGEVDSSMFPTIDAYDSTFNGDRDCFVMKFDQYGNLVYSTFIGGSGFDTGVAIEVDDFGNIYVAGNTFSTDFPVINANQSENNGNWDCFILKLNPAGESRPAECRS